MKIAINPMAWLGVGMVLLALTLTLLVGSPPTPPGEVLGAGSLATVLGCVTCAGAGIYAVSSGAWLGMLLWSTTGFTASLACVGVCAAALGA